jgi:hypothetical protein
MEPHCSGWHPGGCVIMARCDASCSERSHLPTGHSAQRPGGFRPKMAYDGPTRWPSCTTAPICPMAELAETLGVSTGTTRQALQRAACRYGPTASSARGAVARPPPVGGSTPTRCSRPPGAPRCRRCKTRLCDDGRVRLRHVCPAAAQRTARASCTRTWPDRVPHGLLCGVAGSAVLMRLRQGGVGVRPRGTPCPH